MNSSMSQKSRLIRICDSHRRKSFVKCYPSIVNLLEKGRSHFQKQLTHVVLEVDGSMIVEDEVLDLLSSEGLTFMLLENSEEWSLAENNLTFSIDNNDERNTQISQEPLKCQSLIASGSTLSSVAQIEEANCSIIYASVSNASTIEDPLTLPSTSSSMKRTPSLNDVRELPQKRSRGEYSSIPIRNPSIASSCVTVDEANSTIDYGNESELPAPEDPLLESVTSETLETNSPSSQEFEAPTNPAMVSASLDPNIRQKCPPKVPIPPENYLSASANFAKFEINWNIIPNDVLDQLEGRQPDAGYRGISETNYNRFVDHITAQMRTICTKIPFRMFRNIAVKITTKYSALRDYDDDANLIGDGSNSLADKLRNHNSYLNRINRIANHTIRRKGVSNRQCLVGIKEEYSKCGKSYCRKDQLILLTRNNPDMNNLNEDVLSGTAPYIRHKVDSSVSLEALHKELPMIRREELLNYHFQAATGYSAEAFTTNFVKKRMKLIEVSRLYNKALHIPSNAQDYTVLEGVSKLLGEHLSSVIFEIEDIHENVQSTDNFPSIVFINHCDDGEKYFIHAENTFLTLGVNNIVHAIQQLLVVYFVYFYKYPKKVSKTLEFLQMFLLKLYPEFGTRSTATIVGRQQRMVASLISKITKLDWRKLQGK